MGSAARSPPTPAVGISTSNRTQTKLVSTVTIRREFDFPSFGAGKWTKTDHDRPLRLQLAVARALIYLDEDKYAKRDLIVFPQGRIELVYDPVPDELLAGLRSKGAKASATAQMIYDA